MKKDKLQFQASVRLNLIFITLMGFHPLWLSAQQNPYWHILNKSEIPFE
jgi:hypothetical protein